MINRTFSEFDKNVIRAIVSLDTSRSAICIQNIFNNLLSSQPELANYYITLKSATNIEVVVKRGYMHKATYADGFDDIHHELNSKFTSIIALFQYFERELLVYFVSESDLKTTQYTLGNPISDYTTVDFLNPKLKSILYDYAPKHLFITDTLISLVQKDFKSDEEIRFRKSLKFAWATSIISILALIATIGIPFWTNTTVVNGDSLLKTKDEGISKLQIDLTEKHDSLILEINESSQDRMKLYQEVIKVVSNLSDAIMDINKDTIPKVSKLNERLRVLNNKLNQLESNTKDKSKPKSE